MRYVSTRGRAPVLGFEDVLLTGLASDGGLYVPETWPEFSCGEIRALRGKPYNQVAEAVIAPFAGDAFSRDDLAAMIADAYACFAHPAVTPLRQVDANQWLLELFHGPTLAFKDVAMQLLARLMDRALERRGQTATIVGATSGDTGSAAIEAFKNSQRTRLFILHPEGRVSDVQRRQMTTVRGRHIHNIALQGDFDDCQAMLKSMFNDQRFRTGVGLAGVNSINWARIVSQVVYYFTAALALGAPERRVGFTVPTGNFGDIYAGHAARAMGLPIADLVIACNANNILDRTMKTGRYERRQVVPTEAPSMDIQVSSNFERALFEASGRDGTAVELLMSSLNQSGAFSIEGDALKWLHEHFSSATTEPQAAREMMAQTRQASGELLDPHTAVGHAIARRVASEQTPMVTLATAHPAKFPDAVKAATGVHPELPPALADLMQRPEEYTVLENDLATVQAHIQEHI